METEGSSPSSQELSTCTYPEPEQSSLQHSLSSLEVGRGANNPTPQKTNSLRKGSMSLIIDTTRKK
jgi:hypothetical protein